MSVPDGLAIEVVPVSSFGAVVTECSVVDCAVSSSGEVVDSNVSSAGTGCGVWSALTGLEVTGSYETHSCVAGVIGVVAVNTVIIEVEA